MNPPESPRRRSGPLSGRPHARYGAVALFVVTAAVAAPAAPAASERSFDLPTLFDAQVRSIKQQTTVPVLLPQTLRVDARRLHPSGGAGRAGWDLQLGSVARCGGATACFVASFTAQRNERPHFRQRVRLRGGRTGYFKPLTCGASCSPPIIEWRRKSVLYAIQARVGSARTERRELVRLANSAIRRGPR